MQCLRVRSVAEFAKIWENESKVNAQNGFWIGQICNALRVMLDAGHRPNQYHVQQRAGGGSIETLFRMGFAASCSYAKARKLKELRIMTATTMALAEKYREMAVRKEDDHSYDLELFGYLKCRLKVFELGFPENANSEENAQRIVDELMSTASIYGASYRLRIAEDLHNAMLSEFKENRTGNTIGGRCFGAALKMAKSIESVEGNESVLGIEFVVVNKARITLTLALWHRQNGNMEQLQSIISALNEAVAELKVRSLSPDPSGFSLNAVK